MKIVIKCIHSSPIVLIIREGGGVAEGGGGAVGGGGGGAGDDGEGGVGFAPKGLARWAYKEPISSYSIYIGPWCDLSAPIRPPGTKAGS